MDVKQSLFSYDGERHLRKGFQYKVDETRAMREIQCENPDIIYSLGSRSDFTLELILELLLSVQIQS